MSQEQDGGPDYIDMLKRFRAIHVEERRRVVASALDLREENKGEGGLFGDGVMRLQSQIEAIDRAIKDEEDLRPSYLESNGLRVF